MSAPQDEAIDILKGVLDSFFNGSVDLTNVLRRCVHVRQILNWGDLPAKAVANWLAVEALAT